MGTCAAVVFLCRIVPQQELHSFGIQKDSDPPMLVADRRLLVSNRFSLLRQLESRKLVG